MDNTFGIESTAFEGKRLVALVPIKAGTVLFNEPAVLHFHLDKAHDVLSLPNLMSALSQMTKEDRDVFEKLSNSFKTKAALAPKAGATLDDHWEDRGALEAYGKYLTNRHKWYTELFIFPTYARMNHSCNPNCDYEVDARRHTMAVKTTRDVDKGEPLTVTEIDVLLLSADRQKMLLHHFNFTCCCSVCRLPQQELMQSDLRRSRMHKFDELLAAWIQGPNAQNKVSGIQVLNEGYVCFDPKGLAEQEGFNGRQDFIIRRRQMMLEVAIKIGAHVHAKTCALELAKAYCSLNGSDDAGYLFFANCAIDPTRHVLWNTRRESVDSAEAQSSLSEERGGGGAGGKKKRNKKKKQRSTTTSKESEELTLSPSSALVPHALIQVPPGCWTLLLTRVEDEGDDTTSGTLTPVAGAVTPSQLIEAGRSNASTSAPQDEPPSSPLQEELGQGYLAVEEIANKLVEVTESSGLKHKLLIEIAESMRNAAERTNRPEQILPYASDADNDVDAAFKGDYDDEEDETPGIPLVHESANTSGWRTVMNDTNTSADATPTMRTQAQPIPSISVKVPTIAINLTLPPSPPDSPSKTRSSTVDVEAAEDVESRPKSPTPSWRRRSEDGQDDEKRKGPEPTAARASLPELSIMQSKLGFMSAPEKDVVAKNIKRAKQFPLELPMSHPWSFFYTDSSRMTRGSSNYNATQHLLFDATTVPMMLGSLKSLQTQLSASSRTQASSNARHADPKSLADHLRPGTSYALFRQGANPTWENEWNRGGGRLMCVTANKLGAMFEHVMMLLIGDTFDDLVSNQPTASSSSTTVARSGGKDWSKKDDVPYTPGTIVGVIANKRREGGDRIEVWLAGEVQGSKPNARWVEKVRAVLARELDVGELIFSVFKTLTDQQVTVELKNDLSIVGTLKSVDQFLNIKLENIRVVDEDKHPHMIAVRNCFIRGSVVRYVQIPKAAVDTQLLEDATRRENANAQKGGR
ncbi:hypothetical protein ACM66B_004532 [Microbotryomycetes sp. NB124-2]